MDDRKETCVRPKLKPTFQSPASRILVSSLVGLTGAVALHAPARSLLAQAGPGDGSPAAEAEPASASGEPVGRVEYRVRLAERGVEVDGQLDEPAWESATSIPLPYETSPGDNEQAPVTTACYVSYDIDRLYLGCEASDPSPDRIRAYITDRDDTRGHDRVIVAVDPFNDARRAFEFGISALGVQSDAVYDEQSGQADDSWDAIWSSAGRITRDGYVVEAAVPFKSLRFPDTEGAQTWGFYARREWPRSDRVVTRSMYWDRGEACLLCQANLITGIQGVSPGLNVQLNPTLTTRKVDSRTSFPAGSLENGSPDPSFGLNARWSLTTDLTLNATYNPDFSQVEADAPQLDANSRFALFFPEKRPFFLEGAEFFGTPLRAVFTRSVADPVFGTKLSGKIAGNALGAMVAVDRVNNLLFPGNQGSASTSLDQEVTATFARFRRDVGSSNTIGALYTGRMADGYQNHVAGADAFFRPLPALSVSAQLMRSTTEYPDGLAEQFRQPRGSFGGTGARMTLRYSTRKWSGNLNARALDPDFRADAGFIPQVDVRGVNGWMSRKFWGDQNDLLTRVSLNGGFWHTESWEGDLSDQGIWTTVSLQGPWQSDVWLNPNLRRQRFAGEIHEFFQLWSGFGLRPTGSVGVNVWGMVGGGVDFANAREADQVRINPSLDLRAGRHLDLRAALDWQRQALGGREIFTASVSELRAVYNFDPRTFLRAIVQLRDTHRNPELHDAEVNPDRTAVTTQLLFSYKLNPLTVIFLGYSDDRLGLTEPDRTRIPLTQRERALFLKLGYAWRP